MTDHPASGGSYTRDLLTGELVRVPDDAAPKPEPQPEPQPDTPPAAPKGGK